MRQPVRRGVLIAGAVLIGALTFWAGVQVGRPKTQAPTASGARTGAEADRMAPPSSLNTPPAAPRLLLDPPLTQPRLTLPLRLGVIGDSGSLSYATRNWSVMETPPLSWVDLIVECGIADLGRRAPDREGKGSSSGSSYASGSGFARAWSGYAYSTADIVAHKLDLEASRALEAGEVDVVIVAIGHDDFKSLLAARTRNKQVTDKDVAGMLKGFEERYNAILDRLVAARRGIVIAHTLIEWRRLPFVGMMGLSPFDSERLADATERANQIIKAAAERRRLPLVDLCGLFARLLASQPQLNGTYVETGMVGTESRFFFLPDGIHFGTAASALLLNGLLAEWGPILGLELPPLETDAIVRFSGFCQPRVVIDQTPEPAPQSRSEDAQATETTPFPPAPSGIGQAAPQAGAPTEQEASK